MRPICILSLSYKYIMLATYCVLSRAHVPTSRLPW